MNCLREDAREARQKARRPKLAHEQPSDRYTTGVARARPPPHAPTMFAISDAEIAAIQAAFVAAAIWWTNGLEGNHRQRTDRP
jgi:hypothetical protein